MSKASTLCKYMSKYYEFIDICEIESQISSQTRLLKIKKIKRMPFVVPLSYQNKKAGLVKIGLASCTGGETYFGYACIPARQAQHKLPFSFICFHPQIFPIKKAPRFRRASLCTGGESYFGCACLPARQAQHRLLASPTSSIPSNFTNKKAPRFRRAFLCTGGETRTLTPCGTRS